MIFSGYFLLWRKTITNTDDKIYNLTQLLKINTSKDSISFLQHLTRNRSTEEATEYLTNLISENSSSISSEKIEVFNELFKKHKHELGINAYATGTIWACVIQASSNNLMFS